MTTTHVLKSGRTLGVSSVGPEDAAHVVVLAHPAPGAAGFDPDPEATARHGVRLLSFDRPGYGASELLTDADAAGADAPASVEQAAADIAEYLAVAGIASVSAAGWSAGGRVALALSANYPGLVERVAVIATPAPDEQVPWVGEENRALMEPLAGVPVAQAVRSLGAMFDDAVGPRPGVGALLGFLGVAETDAPVLAAPGVRTRVEAMLERAAAQGNTGMAADIVGYSLLDWGFDPAAVPSPTLLVYGEADTAVPRLHGEWYASVLRDSRLETVAGRGHLVAIAVWDRVLGFLLAE